MTLRPLTRAEVRSIDREAVERLGMSTLVLMENAGRGAADWLSEQAPGARLVIACGPGNNGGDGAVVARHWDARGLPSRLVWFARANQFSADASAQRDILERAGYDQETWDGPIAADRLDALFAQADWIVDALLGTGLTRPVEGPLREVIAAMNRSGKPILALDLPSGLDADTGQPLGLAVRATHTATFVAPKVGFFQPGASAFTGLVHIFGIGVPGALLAPWRESRS